MLVNYWFVRNGHAAYQNVGTWGLEVYSHESQNYSLLQS